jgi:hypothetical protein
LPTAIFQPARFRFSQPRLDHRDFIRRLSPRSALYFFNVARDSLRIFRNGLREVSRLAEIDIIAGFVNLATQGTPLFRRHPPGFSASLCGCVELIFLRSLTALRWSGVIRTPRWVCIHETLRLKIASVSMLIPKTWLPGPECAAMPRRRKNTCSARHKQNG